MKNENEKNFIDPKSTADMVIKKSHHRNGISALYTRSQHNISWTMNSKNVLLCSLVV